MVISWLASQSSKQYDKHMTSTPCPNCRNERHSLCTGFTKAPDRANDTRTRLNQPGTYVKIPCDCPCTDMIAERVHELHRERN